MGPILLYQFVNLLGRLSGGVFHPSLLLDEIDSVGFVSYLAFYVVHPGADACPIDKRLDLDPDGLRNLCCHRTAGV